MVVANVVEWLRTIKQSSSYTVPTFVTTSMYPGGLFSHCYMHCGGRNSLSSRHERLCQLHSTIVLKVAFFSFCWPVLSFCMAKVMTVELAWKSLY